MLDSFVNSNLNKEPVASSSSFTTTSTAAANNKQKKPIAKKLDPYQPVDCRLQMQARQNEDAIPKDPNNGMAESPKKLTITNPPFWISLHKESFDRVRWNSIYKNGNYYETGVTDQFQQMLNSTATKPGLVLDIGMNIGWFTLWARAHGHHVAGFEPNPIMHTRVCESLTLNEHWSDDSSVQIFPYGLGREESTLNLTTGSNPGMSSFHEERLAKRYRKSFPVRVVTLDSVAIQMKWLEPSSVPIYLMKVDVEGHEPFVFGGGTQLLNSGRVQNIIMENSVTDLRTVMDLLAAISNAGYYMHWLSTVTGDPYHLEMLPGINKALKEKVKPGMELDNLGDDLKFFAKVTCNIWW
eukprot:CAMPEP_0194211824 /NCGR_PEP_ID=MMETSP0156-20130528/11242_1 /TAXON_ID=33649 /ORGANISM="Thalassionema nitzschioides, Strain L26-B" /LENGTH=352 /DNA_ID=CAMNT_0038939503 /DNA_START=346 /DNA_END=1401 /DNA_ORIENTATION=-